MTPRLVRRYLFYLERWIQKGLLSQLLLMAGLIVFVAVGGGVAGWLATSKFATLPEAIWWAFLRLTDPGYLGDDEGTALRITSTIVTVLGYVIFMGSLIAIMTQWLAKTIRRLESGLTPISMEEHVVVLGWTNRTPDIVQRLLSARGRLQRFLEQQNANKLRIVVLADDVGAERRLELREYLGEYWNEGQIFLRSGSSLQSETLERLDLKRASVVVVPGADFELGGSELSDTRVVKTLLTLNRLLSSSDPDKRPMVIGEIFDPRKVRLALDSVERRVEIVASDRIVSRLMSQVVRHDGLGPVLLGILTHREGNSLYVRGFPDLAGNTARAIEAAFPKAIVLGTVRPHWEGLMTNLDPQSEELLQPDDLLVLLAASYHDCEPVAFQPEARAEPTAVQAVAVREDKREHKILILGWSHKITSLLSELDKSSATFDLKVMSRVSIEERDRWFERSTFSRERIRIENVLGDYAIEADVSQVDAAVFDHVLLLASAWMDTSEEADARTILGFVLLRSLLKNAPDPPEILVELLDSSNSELFDDSQGLVLVSPRLVSHVMAHVALRPELNAVFDQLFGAGGAEIALARADELGLSGRDVTFADIRGATSVRGMTAMGVLVAARSSPAIHLNPDRERVFSLAADDRLIVLSREET